MENPQGKVGIENWKTRALTQVAKAKKRKKFKGKRR